MIKSTVVDKKEKKYPHFPRLLISTKNDSIVLFLRSKEGTLIKAGERDIPEKVSVGAFVTNWNMNFFVEYDKTVILENA